MTTPSPLPDWWLPACRKHYGLSPDRPAGMPKPAPAWCIAEWGMFDRWSAWKDKGHGYPRPTDIWPSGADFPKWPWTIRGELLAKHKKPPPPPAPPGPVAEIWWPGAPWWNSILYTAWGLARENWTPEELVALAVETGYKGVAIEGFPASKGATFPDGSSSDNTPYAAPLRAACHAASITYSMWHRADQMTYSQIKQDIEAFGPLDGYLADVETFPLIDPSFPGQVARDFPNMPRAVIIAGMPDPPYVADLVKHRFDCCTQTYIGTNGAAVVGGMDRDAYWRKWKPIIVHDASKPLEEGCVHTFPCAEVGLEGAPAMRDQINLYAGYPGPSAYCAEAGRDNIALK